MGEDALFGCMSYGWFPALGQSDGESEHFQVAAGRAFSISARWSASQHSPG